MSRQEKKETRGVSGLTVAAVDIERQFAELREEIALLKGRNVQLSTQCEQLTLIVSHIVNGQKDKIDQKLLKRCPKHSHKLVDKFCPDCLEAEGGMGTYLTRGKLNVVQVIDDDTKGTYGTDEFKETRLVKLQVVPREDVDYKFFRAVGAPSGSSGSREPSFLIEVECRNKPSKTPLPRGQKIIYDLKGKVVLKPQ
jgi:hypothetical protein